MDYTKYDRVWFFKCRHNSEVYLAFCCSVKKMLIWPPTCRCAITEEHPRATAVMTVNGTIYVCNSPLPAWVQTSIVYQRVESCRHHKAAKRKQQPSWEHSSNRFRATKVSLNQIIEERIGGGTHTFERTSTLLSLRHTIASNTPRHKRKHKP